MNVTEYISSGILESYVMGAVSDQEQREVECLSSVYPDIQQELDQLSDALETYTLAFSVEPPATVKARLLEQLDFDKPAPTIVRPLPVDRPSFPTYRTTWLVAASVGLLLLLFSFFLLSRLRTNQENLTAFRTANDSLKTEMRQLRGQQMADQQRLAVLQRAGMRVIQLRGNEKSPNSDILVYWNTRTQQVSVDVKSLPKLPADQQYQLWSLVGDKPVNAGVFESSPITSANRPVQMLNGSIARADAFAVTVEKRGGSPTPTLSTLLAMTPLKA